MICWKPGIRSDVHVISVVSLAASCQWLHSVEKVCESSTRTRLANGAFPPGESFQDPQSHARLAKQVHAFVYLISLFGSSCLASPPFLPHVTCAKALSASQAGGSVFKAGKTRRTAQGTTAGLTRKCQRSRRSYHMPPCAWAKRVIIFGNRRVLVYLKNVQAANAWSRRKCCFGVDPVVALALYHQVTLLMVDAPTRPACQPHEV